MPEVSEAVTVPVQSNLPLRRYRSLVGRENVVRHAIDILDEEHPAENVLIYGPAGSGKTSVAIEAVHRMTAVKPQDRHLHFDALVWLSARPAILTVDGVLRSPLVCGTLSDFVTNICAVLGRTDVMRALPDEQPALLRAALSQKSTLIVADDLDEVEDERVLSFLSSLPGVCRVLATARSQLDFGKPVRLGPLSFPEVQDLLRQIQDGEDIRLSYAEATRLHELCGGIPLAIVWAVNLVRLGYDVSHILDNFGETTSDLLKFCFFKAWDSVQGTPVGELLVAIALFSDGASLELARRTSGLTDRRLDFDRALVKLRRLGVLEATATRLNLLPMTRTYIMGSIMPQPSGSDGDDVRTRWVDALADHVARSLAQPRWQDCFDLLEVERANIESLFEWARTRQNETVYARASALYSDVSYFLFCRGYWSQLVDHGNWALPALRAQGLGEEYLTVLLTWVSRVHLLRGDEVNLRACFDEATDFVATSPPDARLLYEAIIDYNRVTHLNPQAGEHNAPSSVQKLRRVADVFRELGRDEWFARVVNRLGNMLSASQDSDAAIEAFTQVIDASEPYLALAWGKDMTGISKGNLGILANRQGRYEEAIPLLHQSQNLVAQAMDGAVALMELAIAHYHLGQRAQALALAIQARTAAAALDLAVSIAESDTSWEKEVLPQLLAESATARANVNAIALDPETVEQIDQLLQQATEGGMADLSSVHLEEQLGIQLQELVLETAATATPPPQWASGDYGPLNLGRRFIEYHKESIRSQLCLPNCQGLKPEYAQSLSFRNGETGGLLPLVVSLLATLNSIEPAMAVPVVAVFVALWLARVDLDRFCRQM
ncbi:putative tetratricopeptide repeat protein [Streptomyces himastatinicus ATCC 53653]|uniref:Putative tetratricopeptide repeat protein n=1 Tax=Streptomyces himastatinicus ATCC 53653 TaxID=457427 RepID=D9WBK9_9ACTN|nr:tetratricopeptide repeat protein [Streptomyces himastatinicus]EFL24965.1 putative tetratricopeptide repeat protein [Streptomyces himastatinicus ATCC 53653]